MTRSHAAPAGRPARPRSAGASSKHAPHAVHLIGGRWKRSRLPVPDRPGLRPTPARVRETLFNWLGQDLPGWRVLDAFAGSGALGLEAASRGAAQVTLLERDGILAAALRATCQRLRGPAASPSEAPRLEVQAADALSWMARCAPASFDLVLLDPPFDAALWDAALQCAQPLVVAGGWIYLESPIGDVVLPPGLQIHREGRAGAVQFRLLRRTG